MSNALEIRVAAMTPCANLASSIVRAYAEGKEITLTAIGPAPISAAFKAVCIANRMLSEKQVRLIIIPSLVERPLWDRELKKQIAWVVALLRLRNSMETMNEDLQSAEWHDSLTPGLETLKKRANGEK